MKVIIQRVLEAKVLVDELTVGEIGKGYLLFVGVSEDDDFTHADWLVRKILSLRIFSDIEGKMNLSIEEVQGEILCVSQFTLFTDYKKGNRPSFICAARPEHAIPMIEYFKTELKKSSLKVESGVFGADMKVLLINDGPVTIVMDTETKM